MKGAKIFIAITSVIRNGKTVAVVAGSGALIANEKGLTLSECLDFFLSLRVAVPKREKVVFVCYGFSRDNEFIFQDLPNDLKDRLFQSHTIRRHVEKIEYDLERIYDDIFNGAEDDAAMFDRGTNELALQEAQEVKFDGYDIKLRNGKFFTLTKDKKRFCLYDLFGFFRSDLPGAVKTWLKQNYALPKNSRNLQLSINAALCQARVITDLAIKLNEELQTNGINLRNYHGTGAVASWILAQGDAKHQFNNYRHRRQLPDGLYDAVLQGYYAGRAEQFKIGHVNKRIQVYDINSAYAYASTFLPLLLQKPKFVRNWSAAPFSLWHCEFDFSSVNPYFGFLPYRERGKNETTYKVKGRGHFWQPEVAYILSRYPQCIDVHSGYVMPYEIAPFTEVIKEIYDLRLDLKKQGHPLADVLKLALSSIYGKFCQRDNKGFYHNRLYAGFITSLTRAQLLQICEGNEQNVLCFLTDAIHTTAPLNTSVSDELGACKVKEYESGFYLDSGVYSLRRKDGTFKQATRGFRSFDFLNAVKQFETSATYTANLDLFISYNLHALLPFHYHEYLKIRSEQKESTPLETSMRSFDRRALDGVFNSRIKANDSRAESGVYLQHNYTDAEIGRDSILTGLI